MSAAQHNLLCFGFYSANCNLLCIVHIMKEERKNDYTCYMYVQRTKRPAVLWKAKQNVMVKTALLFSLHFVLFNNLCAAVLL